MSVSDWTGFGLGVGLGKVYPGLIWQSIQAPAPEAVVQVCDRCRRLISQDAAFCAHCGEPVHAVGRCVECGSGMLPGARFCYRCGAKAWAVACSSCGSEPPPGSKFCTRCGEELDPEARSEE